MIGDDNETRTTDLHLLLLGAYHDVKLWVVYKGVTALNMKSPNLEKGHGDWRYDEFRLSNDGLLLHEIEWQGWRTHSRWLVTAKEIEFDVVSIAPAA